MSKNKLIFFDKDIFSWRIGNETFYISPQVCFLCNWMDGKTSKHVLIQNFKQTLDIDLSREDLKPLLNKLKDLKLLYEKKDGYLVSRISRYYLKKQQRILNRNKIREPMFSGICYKSNPRALARDVSRCFNAVDDHLLSSYCKGIKSIKGIIAPHSNMELSGPCAGWAYKALSLFPAPDTIIIFGPNHFSRNEGPFTVIPKDFRTPFGIVEYDKEFTRILERNCDLSIYGKDKVFLQEHSIEMQLPFLQYCYRDKINRLKIVPVLCGGKGRLKDPNFPISKQKKIFIQALRKTIRDSKQSVLCIGSDDLLHKKRAIMGEFHARNNEIIRLLENGDSGQIRRIQLEDSNFGKDLFISFLSILKPIRGKKLQYSWSSRPNFFHKNNQKRILSYQNKVTIGYASMLFY